MIATIHEIAPEEVMAHHDGELSAERDQLVSAHIETCTECREQLESLKATSLLVATWTLDSTPPSLTPELLRASIGNRAHDSIDFAVFWRRLHHRRMAVVLGLAVAAIAFRFVAIETPKSFRSQLKQEDVTPLDLDGYVPKLPAGVSKAGGGGGGGGDRESAAAVRGKAPHFVVPAAPPPASNHNDSEESAANAPMIARTVELKIVVKKFDDARFAVQSILLRHRGYAASLNASDTDNTARTLNASLRIPSQELATALSDLKALGHVTNESQAGVELTAEHADLVARLKNSRETEIRLQDILRNRTGKVSDVLEVEQEIARVRGEIEELESERKTLEHRVDFATVNLSLVEEYKAKVGDSTPGTATRFHNAAIAGFRNVTNSALGLTLWFAEYLPPIIFWLVILLAPLTLFWRLRRRAIAATVSPLG
jgi:hypothetical protein